MLVGEIKKDVAVLLGDADVHTARSGPSNCARASSKLRVEFAICARGIPRRLVVLAAQPARKRTLRIGQVSRCPLIARSANAVPVGV